MEIIITTKCMPKLVSILMVLMMLLVAVFQLDMNQIYLII